MKQIYLSVIIVIISSATFFGQQNFSRKTKKLDNANFIINYNLVFQPDTADIHTIIEEPMVLLVGDKISLFIDYWALCGDSVLKEMQSLEEFQEFLSDPSLQPPNPRVLCKIYKNYPEKKITYIEPITFDVYKYLEDLHLFNWSITEETMQWNKYNLQKATTEFGGRKWEAWFAADIPISDGPYKFNGLPGLIIKVSDTKNHYRFQLSSIQTAAKDATIDIISDINYLETNKKGFIEAYQNYRNNVVETAKSAGFNSPETVQKISENVKKRNNPIELIVD